MSTDTKGREGLEFRCFLESLRENRTVDEMSWEQCKEMTNDEILSEFYRWMKYEKGYTTQTIQGKIKKVRKFLRETRVHVTEVDTELRKAYKAYLLEKLEQGMHKRNYVATILTDLNVFFCNFLGQKHLRVSSINKEYIYGERYTKDDVRAMLREVDRRDIPEAKKKLHRALIITLWTELPRISELHHLTLGDMRKLTKHLKLRSGKRDRVPEHLRYPLTTQDFLDAWNDYLPHRDSDDWSDDAPAFPQVKSGGRPTSKKFVRHMLKDYAERAGIEKPIYPHMMRKSGGTELTMNNPKLGQIHLGHKSIRTTLDHYSMPDDQDKETINAVISLSLEDRAERAAAQLDRCVHMLDTAVNPDLTQPLTPKGTVRVEGYTGIP